MTTSADIANQALMMMGGNQPLVQGNWPTFVGVVGASGSAAAAQAANVLYGAAVATVGREFAWDFGRNTQALALSGGTAPYPWALEYLYPADAIEIWELSPITEVDPNDPLPVNYVIANALVSSVQRLVIHTNLASAQAIYNNKPNESTWNPLFREAVVRLLASEFAMALAGKPDTSETLLQSGSAFEQLGEARRD